VGQRGGYFDPFGIIRDVMQNHLLQILALVAMDEPAQYSSAAIRDAKVALLDRIVPVRLDRMVTGQYDAAPAGGRPQPAYTGEPGVPRESRTPTYAAAVLEIAGDRWQGVPFWVEAGKAVNERINEIRITFKARAGSVFGDAFGPLAANEMVIRVQPDEAIQMRINNKVPGLKMALQPTELDLRYHAAFDALIPDAYECLLLDVLRGDRSLFIRADELAAAWDVFTPVLHALDDQRVVPERYSFGSAGPAGARQLAERWGFANG
jgi:glucose-6-phosphate 1-dehydrogenase